MAHSLCPKVKLQVPPLRCAPVGMTKWRVVLHLGSGRDGGTESNNEVPTPTKEPICKSMAENSPGHGPEFVLRQRGFPK